MIKPLLQQMLLLIQTVRERNNSSHLDKLHLHNIEHHIREALKLL